MMTNKDLIEKLQQFPLDLPIAIVDLSPLVEQQLVSFDITVDRLDSSNEEGDEVSVVGIQFKTE